MFLGPKMGGGHTTSCFKRLCVPWSPLTPRELFLDSWCSLLEIHPMLLRASNMQSMCALCKVQQVESRKV